MNIHRILYENILDKSYVGSCLMFLRARSRDCYATKHWIPEIGVRDLVIIHGFNGLN